MTPEQKKRKAYRKIKQQREKALADNKTAANKAKRKAHRKASSPLKLNWDVEPLAELKEDDPVLLHFKNLIEPPSTFVSAEFVRPKTKNSPALVLRIHVKVGKAALPNAYDINYNKFRHLHSVDPTV